jgi:hypothetical protein
MDWLVEVEYWDCNQEDTHWDVWVVHEVDLNEAWDTIKMRYVNFEGINSIRISNYSK